MKKSFNKLLFIIPLLFCVLFVSACSNKNDPANNPPTPPQVLYDRTTIEKSLAFEDYCDVSFSTKFATITIHTSSGLIGTFDMQGEMTQVSTSSIICTNYDVIKIENAGLWDSTTRRVKITFYKYETIILDAYSTTENLEAQMYILCDSKIVQVHMV